MLYRLLPKSSHLRLLSNLYSNSPPIPLPPRLYHPHFILRSLSTSGGNGNGNGDKSASDVWRFPGESDGKFDSFFAPDGKDGLAGFSGSPAAEEGSWLEEDAGDDGSKIFEGGEKEYEPRSSGQRDDDWLKSDGEKMWTLDEAGEDRSNDVFGIGDVVASSDIGDIAVSSNAIDQSDMQTMLEQEEKALTAVLKGPNRAFGDLIAASGITDAMLDSLIALRDFEGVEGLPPLSEIEDLRYEKTTRKSSRAEMERQKQEEVAKARVRQVDEKGRAYGLGRRKCSVARVWIQPGEGKFKINDKEFDVYFPMLDHRAALLRPFSETKTLGLWDIDCTVKGGGLSGQVGAIQLGISRALQNWEPDLRPPLRDCGFLTRDPRVVERKKPGKAKARKSFQWVKR